MSAKFSLSHFIGVFYGGLFDGALKLWSRKTKKTISYGSDNIGEFAADVERRKHAEDLYVGLSTQPADLSETARGSNDTAMMLPGMVADIDFANAKDGNKRYPPNADTALSLIQSFDYKPLLIQNTGNGLHVLFKLDRPLVMQNREARRRGQSILRRFGRKLARHFEQAGYEIDNVSDLARVYRVPGTYNHKSGGPKPVTVLEYNPDNRLSLDELERDLPSVDEAPAKSSAPGIADHSAIQQNCAWYRHYTSDGAATADEPNWYAASSITARCKDGPRIFHEYSRSHAGYDEREATTKLQRTLEEAGPRTCASIANDLGQSRFCESCPHFQTITSPIQLGNAYDPGSTGPQPLGFTKDGLFALLDPVRKIVVVASAQQLLAEQYLLGLAESRFWLRQFPHEKRSVSFKMAGEALLRSCRRAGPFNPTRIRGRGTWLEDGKVVVNLGGAVESSKHIYLCFEPIDLDRDITFDAQRLKDHLQLYKWRNPLVCGQLVLPQLFQLRRRGAYLMATAFEQLDAVPGFSVPVHRALTEHIMLGGAPRSIAIMNGTLAGAVGLGLRLWLLGLAIWAIGHFAAVWAAKRDPLFVEVGRRHLRIPGHLAV